MKTTTTTKTTTVIPTLSPPATETENKPTMMMMMVVMTMMMPCSLRLYERAADGFDEARRSTLLDVTADELTDALDWS